jgi:hypothetical protein
VHFILDNCYISKVTNYTMTWISDLFGVEEVVGLNTHIPGIEYRDGVIYSTANGKSYRAGKLEIKSVAELAPKTYIPGKPIIRIEKHDVSILQGDTCNKHAMFQTASQFNCLEFINQHTTPENGITGWVADKTQGPAAAISCRPGSVVRNYFAFDNAHSQKRSKQINTLSGFEAAIGTGYFTVKNGYIFASDEQLISLNKLLKTVDIQPLIDCICVGILQDTQVTSHTWGTVKVDDTTQLITQVICSACSVSYNTSSKDLWEPLARLVLCAQYSAAVACAISNKQRTGVSKLFLAPLGGSAFGNDPKWIVDGIKYALARFPECGLDITLVAWKSADVYKELLGIN